jgi:hypothetical protein
MRFTPDFDSSEAALLYATAQGLDWIGSAAAGQTPACPAPVSLSSHTPKLTAWPTKN